MARLFLVLAAFLATASAFMAPASSVVGKQSTISMSTQFTDPFVQKMKKKNPATGSTKNLKGYTVGSRAPIVAKSSGTTQNGYKTNNPTNCGSDCVTNCVLNNGKQAGQKADSLWVR